MTLLVFEPSAGIFLFLLGAALILRRLLECIALAHIFWLIREVCRRCRVLAAPNVFSMTLEYDVRADVDAVVPGLIPKRRMPLEAKLRVTAYREIFCGKLAAMLGLA
jgi:hypothetical protein